MKCQDALHPITKTATQPRVAEVAAIVTVVLVAVEIREAAGVVCIVQGVEVVASSLVVVVVVVFAVAVVNLKIL